MTDFEKEVQSKAVAIAEQKTPGPVQPFDDVLKQFVNGLAAASPHVGAAIDRGEDPLHASRSFVTWPRCRRDERTIMLSFWWDGSGLTVTGDNERKQFKTTDELQAYLLNFLSNTEFPRTMWLYKQRCAEPVDG
jgi:hypothetical protein